MTSEYLWDCDVCDLTKNKNKNCPHIAMCFCVWTMEQVVVSLYDVAMFVQVCVYLIVLFSSLLTDY